VADREKAVLALRKELEMVSHILNTSINERMRENGELLGKNSGFSPFSPGNKRLLRRISCVPNDKTNARELQLILLINVVRQRIL